MSLPLLIKIKSLRIMHTHILRTAAVLNSTIVRQNRDVSGEVKWGKAYSLLFAHRAKEWGIVPTDISLLTDSILFLLLKLIVDKSVLYVRGL
jgi:hypothetical protein